MGAAATQDNHAPQPIRKLVSFPWVISEYLAIPPEKGNIMASSAKQYAINKIMMPPISQATREPVPAISAAYAALNSQPDPIIQLIEVKSKLSVLISFCKLAIGINPI